MSNNKEVSFKELAFKFLSDEKKFTPFLTIWEHVSKGKTIDGDKNKVVSDFYFSLILDKRFFKNQNNEWSLRDLFQYEKVKDGSKSVFYEMDDEGQTKDMYDLEEKEEVEPEEE